MRILFCLLTFICTIYQLQAQDELQQKVIAGRINGKEQQAKPYVILISIDGFRHDYAEKFGAQNLQRLGVQGVKAKSMLPSFPSLTFPNHYTIATGLYPSHHGLVNNNFYDASKNETYTMSNKMKVRDGTWYEGTPLWVLAEQQKMLSASYFWVGSEAPIKGISPTYFYNYTEKQTIKERINEVVKWLELPEEKRPHLITFYFPEVDHAGHDYGPNSTETKNTVLLIDSSIQQLTEAVAKTNLPVNFIVVSDHGMTEVDTKNTLKLPPGVDTSKFYIPAEGNLVEMYAKDKVDVYPAYQLLKKNENNYKVYLKSNVPKYWHYGEKDDVKNRIGDIIIVSEWPKVFNLRNRKISPGWHGYDPKKVADMEAIFYAWGPAFKNNKAIGTFENIHVYPLIAKILGLAITEPIDGKLKVLKKILK